MMTPRTRTMPIAVFMREAFPFRNYLFSHKAMAYAWDERPCGIRVRCQRGRKGKRFPHQAARLQQATRRAPSDTANAPKACQGKCAAYRSCPDPWHSVAQTARASGPEWAGMLRWIGLNGWRSWCMIWCPGKHGNLQHNDKRRTKGGPRGDHLRGG